MKLVIAGWKSVSLVDVYGYTSFTIWTCGCNLKCPFCHNWRLADNDPSVCYAVDVEELIEECTSSRLLVDYLHVTGGEPLIQAQGLVELFKRAESIGVKRSLNSNLTMPRQLEHLLSKNLVEHVATDLKIPPEELYGVEPQLAVELWTRFLESISLTRNHDVQLELRIPLSRKLTPMLLEFYLDRVAHLLNIDNTVVLLNPLLGEPIVKPRNPEWCKKNCGVGNSEINEYVEVVKQKGFKKIVIKSVPGFQR
ncbi:MAG: anaerobic ribonucleoside-triphosphate reductase activating protein [Desulfurococcaceae archaeon]